MPVSSRAHACVRRVQHRIAMHWYPLPSNALLRLVSLRFSTRVEGRAEVFELPVPCAVLRGRVRVPGGDNHGQACIEQRECTGQAPGAGGGPGGPGSWRCHTAACQVSLMATHWS